MTEPYVPETRRATTAWRAWGLGLTIAVLGALVLFAFARLTHNFGWALVLGAPAAVGFALGYGLRFKRGWLIALALVVVLSVVGGLAWAGLGGLLCGLIFSVIAAGPTVLGVLAGYLLRRRLDSEDPGREVGSQALSLILVVVVGGAVELEGRLTVELESETVVTRRTLDFGPSEAWDRLMFYEEVPLPPPLLARLGIPHPLRTEGRVSRTGDVKLCVYSTGHLRKRITDYQPGRRLAFDVIEQVGVEDRSAQLLSGSFRFEPAGDGRTVVELTTTYRPLLQARWVWRPFERAVAHLLHRHVLDGMQSKAPIEYGLLVSRAATNLRYGTLADAGMP